MTWFSKVAYTTRHHPLLEKSDGLWNILRKPYHFLLDIRNEGVDIKISQLVNIKVPAIFYSENLANYEERCVRYLILWIKQNPNAFILDMGCAIGYISTIALFASETCNVIGFDSDIPSLKATQRMSQYASGNRIRLVYGLVSDRSTSVMTIEEAIESTKITIEKSSATGNPGTTQYVNLDKNADKKIPQYSIDTLFNKTTISAPILIKCDIEGSELLALIGSKRFLQVYHPVILLSVHPSILPIFDCTVLQVRKFLENETYNIEIISIDHEEHWWCTYTP